MVETRAPPLRNSPQWGKYKQWVLTMAGRQKKKKKNELTWENEVSREGSVYFMTTQSEVRSVEIWGQDTVTMEKQRQSPVSIWPKSNGFQATVCRLFFGLSLLEAHLSLLLKYLIQLLKMVPRAHTDMLERLNNCLCQLIASITRASH